MTARTLKNLHGGALVIRGSTVLMPETEIPGQIPSEFNVNLSLFNNIYDLYSRVLDPMINLNLASAYFPGVA